MLAQNATGTGAAGVENSDKLRWQACLGCYFSVDANNFSTMRFSRLAGATYAHYKPSRSGQRPSSSGQDAALSRRKQGFDSPWAYQQIQVLR